MCSTKQIEILQVRPFTKEGRCQRKCSHLIYIKIHGVTSPAAGYKVLFTADANHYQFLWIFTSSFPTLKTIQCLHLTSLSSFFHVSFKGKWNVEEAIFTNANGLLHLQVLCAPTSWGSFICFNNIFTIIAFSIQIDILYFSDSLYYKLYIILY